MSKEIILPMNGFTEERPVENGRVTSTREDWPDWDDAEGKSGKGQAVQRQSIQLEDGSSEVLTTTTDDVEEPWDDFETSEVISTDSPPTSLPDPSQSSTKYTRTSVLTATSASARESRALKLMSPSLKSDSEKNISDTGWEQSSGNLKPSKSSLAAEATHKSAHRVTGAVGLGEEFTIEVKSKPDRDRELDFFADMEPEIKISSSSMFFNVGGSVRRSEEVPLTPLSGAEPKDTHTVTTLDLNTKFAAKDLTEVRVHL